MANTARSWSGSRASSQPPCIKVCRTLVTTSVTRARRIGSSPGSALFAALMSTLVNAKAEPAARPQSAAGWTVARSSSRGVRSRPASDSHSTPPTPIAMPIQASVEMRSPSRISARIAPCTASVLA